ncbi:MAG TPA: hypothetical protein VJB59_12555 [Bdellovibrionota bacterium]|nr:hypothetical protein [Bdellovibrionota bacterium]
MRLIANSKTIMRIPEVLVIASSILIYSSCMNSRVTKTLNELTSPTASPTVSLGDSYQISRVTIPNAQNQSTPPVVTVFFKSSQTEMISNVCSLTTESSLTPKPCLCQFSWSEVNQTTGSSIVIPRTVTTNVLEVQPSLVTCNAPQAYNQEVPNGTQIRVSIIAGPSNPNQFSMTAYNFTKTNVGLVGSFQDNQGRYFDNIVRYSCYEQFKRGMAVRNKMMRATKTNASDTAIYPSATQFCVQKIGTTSMPDGCENMPAPENSAQAYYYNFYIRDSERGDINLSNARYICPQVKEPILSNTGTGHTWPLDKSFALSLGPTADFPIGVEAYTKVSDGTATSNGTKCFSNDLIPFDSASRTSSCLGFAARPNKDGTCPFFKDAAGMIRFTYRLRRYIAIYPPVFDTNGSPINQAPASDTIYVLDRPVAAGTADPLKPYTMLGPKPCPFAFFDAKAVLKQSDPAYPGGYKPVYASTNDSRWNGKNVDGIQFPNSDAATDGVASCSAAIPLFTTDYEKSIVTIGTVNVRNPVLPELHIRPIKPWVPYYVEDTEFLACAPQASPQVVDPPLHFAKDSEGNVAWCAEVYPTQNDNIPQLDSLDNTKRLYIGKVKPFTSHVVKHSASEACTATTALNSISASNYPAVTGAGCPVPPAGSAPTAFARHPADLVIDQMAGQNICADKTCDRTAINTVMWGRFPLLAPPDKVEEAIASNPIYNCTLTYDNNSGKTGKRTPSKGCCGTNVAVTSDTATPTTAHLEPSAPCLRPDF